MISAAAGTFNVLHDGHKALLDRAFSDGDIVYIGITSDKMASASRDQINPFYIRERAVREYAETKLKEYRVFSIDDIYGPDDMIDSVDILVVSQETVMDGREVVKRAGERGRRMELSVIDIVRGSTGRKISSSDIMKGICSRNGDRDAIDIAVGSLNPVKIEAVRTVMERIFGQVRLFASDADSGVPEQPFEEQTAKGAENRARKALGEHSLSVGIEAGVFEMQGFLYDIQYCAVVDQGGTCTIGTGPGFRYPDKVADLIRGGMTAGQAMKEIYTGENLGKSIGAVGILSKGLSDRKRLTEQSVMAAMIPRIWDEK